MSISIEQLVYDSRVTFHLFCTTMLSETLSIELNCLGMSNVRLSLILARENETAVECRQIHCFD